MIKFFEHGNAGEFKYYSFAHIIPIIIMISLITICIIFNGKIRQFKFEIQIRFILSFTMLISEMSYFWLKLVPNSNSTPPNLAEHLPITVCGWATVFGSYLLVTKSQTLFDIIYFWILSGSWFALLTPAVITGNGPTHFRYYQFWVQHTSLFVCLAYMIWVHNMRPNIKSIVRSLGAFSLLTVLAIFANKHIEGANYLFLTSTKEGKSVLNSLPADLFPRLMVMASIILVGYVLAYLPWYIIDKKKQYEKNSTKNIEASSYMNKSNEGENSAE